jgi:hypothetical protein
LLPPLAAPSQAAYRRILALSAGGDDGPEDQGDEGLTEPQPSATEQDMEQTEVEELDLVREREEEPFPLLGIPKDVLRMIFHPNFLDSCTRVSLRFVSKLINRLVSNIWTQKSRKVKFTEAAAAWNYLSLLRWAVEAGFSIGPLVSCHLAANGSLEALKWLSTKPRMPALGSPSAVYAAMFGRLEVLQWLVSKGVKLEDQVCEQACENGDLELLQYAISVGAPVSTSLCDIAARHDHFDCVRAAFEKGSPLTGNVCVYAAKHGNLDMLQFALAQGVEINNYSAIMTYAALGGHLRIVKWAFSRGCQLLPTIAATAAMKGHLEVLQWLRSVKTPMDTSVTSMAAKEGQLEVLKWARSVGIPWDEWVRRHAQQFGHRELLNWAIANGAP